MVFASLATGLREYIFEHDMHCLFATHCGCRRDWVMYCGGVFEGWHVPACMGAMGERLLPSAD